MTRTTSTVKGFLAAPPKPDKMVTLVCKSCGMALYMSERELAMPTWRCPACGVITKAGNA